MRALKKIAMEMLREHVEIRGSKLLELSRTMVYKVIAYVYNVNYNTMMSVYLRPAVCT